MKANAPQFRFSYSYRQVSQNQFDGFIVDTVNRIDEKGVTAAVPSVFNDGQSIENVAQSALQSEAAEVVRNEGIPDLAAKAAMDF